MEAQDEFNLLLADPTHPDAMLATDIVNASGLAAALDKEKGDRLAALSRQ